MGKMPQKSFPPSASRAKLPFAKIHSDLKSFPIESYHRHKYFISFVDDYSSYTWIICIHQKSSAIVVLKHFLVMIERQFGTTPKEWMSDAGGEYKSHKFLNVLKGHSIKVLQSISHTPQQNGCAECFNHTIMEKAKAMQHEACLPDSWWEFAIEHAVHCYNRTPVMRLKWRTPYEVVHGKKPDISNLRIFGCGAYVYLPPSIRKDKLAPNSELMIHLGLAEGIKGYRFMRSTNQLFTAANALFDEETFPKCKTQLRRPITRVNEPKDEQPPGQPQDAPPAQPSNTIPWDTSGDQPPRLTQPPAQPSAVAPPPAAPPAPRQPFGRPFARRRIPPAPGQSLDSPPRPPVPRSTGRRKTPSPKPGPSRRPQTPVRAEPPPLPTRSPE